LKGKNRRSYYDTSQQLLNITAQVYAADFCGISEDNPFFFHSAISSIPFSKQLFSPKPKKVFDKSIFFLIFFCERLKTKEERDEKSFNSVCGNIDDGCSLGK